MARLRDIPQFTRAPSYSVNSAWAYLPEWLERHGEEGLNLTPDFQRGHVWTPEQQTRYVEFKLQGGASGADIYFNHPGWMGSWKGDFVCVDGLQRITAVMGFLNGEVKVFGRTIGEFEDKLPPMDPRFAVHINNLKTRTEVLQWYLEMNSGGTVHTSDELQRVKLLLAQEEGF